MNYLARNDGEFFVGVPLVCVGEVDFDCEGNWLRGIVRELKGFAIVVGHQIGVGGSAGSGWRVFPWSAEAGGFPEFPEIIECAEPEACLGGGVVEEMPVGFG